MKVDRIELTTKGYKAEVWSTNKPTFTAAREMMKAKLREKEKGGAK